jgi:hypothetical protein
MWPESDDSPLKVDIVFIFLDEVIELYFCICKPSMAQVKVWENGRVNLGTGNSRVTHPATAYATILR